MAISQTHSGCERFGEKRLAACGGFTLIELVTALMIMGIATTIFINLYTASVTLAETNRGQRVAASLAEEYMTRILNYPGEVDWEALYDAESVTELTRVADPVSVERPTTIPTNQRSYDRVLNLYANYSQEAWARVPAREAGSADTGIGAEYLEAEYLEVVVVIRWDQDGRERSFSLTSTIPRERAQESQST